MTIFCSTFKDNYFLGKINYLEPTIDNCECAFDQGYDALEIRTLQMIFIYNKWENVTDNLQNLFINHPRSTVKEHNFMGINN